MAYQNSRLVEWGLFLFSTFITIVTLFNIIEYAKIINGPGNAYLSDDSAGYWLVVNIILFVIALIYWLYRVYHWLFSSKIRSSINSKVSDYFVKQPYTGIIVTEEESKQAGVGFTVPVDLNKVLRTDSSGSVKTGVNRVDGRDIKAI
jgi:hypothetical protein